MASQLSKSSRAATDRLERAFGHPRTSESFPTNIIIYYIELSRGFVIFDFYPDFFMYFLCETNEFGDIWWFGRIFGGLAWSRLYDLYLRNFPGTHWGTRDHKTWKFETIRLDLVWVEKWAPTDKNPSRKVNSRTTSKKSKFRAKSQSSPSRHLQQPCTPL